MRGFDKKLQVPRLRIVDDLPGRVHRRVRHVVGEEPTTPFGAVSFAKDTLQNRNERILVFDPRNPVRTPDAIWNPGGYARNVVETLRIVAV